MANRPKHVILLGYAKQTLDLTSREAARMREYATLVDELHIIIFTRAVDGLPEQVNLGNLTVYGTHARTKFGMVWRAYQLARQIAHPTPNEWLISAQDPFVPAFIARLLAWRTGLTDHIQMHGDGFSSIADPTWRGALLRQFGWWCIRRVSRIRVVSMRLKARLVAGGVDPAAITVLPIQSDLAQFFIAGESSDVSLHTGTTFLYVGRFAPEKNLPLLLRAFRDVMSTHPECRLTLCGDGPGRTALESLIIELGMQDSVTVIPWTQDVATIMAEADVVCLSSDHEGWGMVLVEAMAVGRPVVTTDVGCAGELVRDGEEGWVVPVGDEPAYRAALEAAAQDCVERRRRGIVARATATSFALPPQVYLQAWYESLGYLRE